MMKWLYFIPHEWPLDDRDTVYWEDIYVKPEEGMKESIWLTIDAKGLPDDESYTEERADIEERLGGKEYVIEDADMIVNQDTMSMTDLLGWVKVWLRDNGFDDVELVAGTHEDFVGTNQHSQEVEHAKEILARCQEEGLIPKDESSS